MSDRFAYESATLSAREPAGELGLVQFATLPAYIGLEPQRDTCYDGSVVLVTAEVGVLCSGRFVVEILGPFCDRVFRMEFSGVTKLELSPPTLMSGFDVDSIVVAEHGDGVVACSIQCKPFGGFVAIEAASARVLRFRLNKALER